MIAGITFNPLLPWWLIAAAIGMTLALAAVVLFLRGRGTLARVLAILALVAALLDPRLVREKREPLSDVVLIAVDRSPSQRIGNRSTQSEQALAALQSALRRYQDIHVRVLPAAAAQDLTATRLFSEIEKEALEIGPERLAGVVLITDGQVHDVPAANALPWMTAPIHVLLTGAEGEIDRRLRIEQAPAYGLVGTTVELHYRIDDLKPSISTTRSPPTARILVAGSDERSVPVPVGVPQTLTVSLDRAGPTLVQLATEELAGEVSTRNNRTAVLVNAVRDRLRVLLISGQPHPGERTWRNLLKSDPAVDLIHFTILRPPDKDDATPLKELSLIVFPVQQLFENNLKEFDLIIFDRYLERGILPLIYFERIAEYVESGGALLVAAGPELAGPGSLARTELQRLLPATPTGRVLELAFRPALTPLGERHPVTAGLQGALVVGDATRTDPANNASWGPWFRLVEADHRNGHGLMEGIDRLPVLIVDRVGNGRVGLLLSDQIWLWARGYEGGGPHAELLRRLAHWLMKEPELEEEGLKARIAQGRLIVDHRSLTTTATEAKLTLPSGSVQSLPLVDVGEGISRGDIPATEPGLYVVETEGQTAVAISGGSVNEELSDLRATKEKLSAIVSAHGGTMSWLDQDLPEIRRVVPGRDTSGQGWIGLRQNRAYTVVGATEQALLPGLVTLAVVLGALALAWWREGH